MKRNGLNTLLLSIAVSSTLISSFTYANIEKRSVKPAGESIPVVHTQRVSDEKEKDEWIVVFKKPSLFSTSQGHLLTQARERSLSKADSGDVKKLTASLKLYKTNLLKEQDDVINQAFSTEGTARVIRQFSSTLNAAVLEATDGDVERLRKNENVQGVFKNKRFKKLLSESTERIGAPVVWEQLDNQSRSITGVGVKVAVIDSGVDYTHPDLGGCIGAGCKVIGGYDFVEDDSDPMDVDGHGTHVAGIVAANGRLKGVAPDAQILAVRVLGDDGFGDTSDIIAGIEYAVDPDGDPTTDDGADVINLSLGGGGGPDSPSSLAADAAANAGVVVVVAAGNDGNYNDIGKNAPSSSRLAITVGSTDKDDTLSYFSSKGPLGVDNLIKPEIVAPGGDINSLSFNGEYEVMSGTSMASPHVAGAAALLLQKNSSLTQTDVKAILMSSAESLSINPYAQGYGLLRIDNAITRKVSSNTPPIDFGGIKEQSDAYSITTQIELKNTTQQAQVVYLSEKTSWPDSVELVLGQREIELAANSTTQIDVTLNVLDPLGIPFSSEALGAYSGAIGILTENGEAFDIPVAFKKSRILTITHDSPYGIDVSVDDDNGNSLYWSRVAADDSLELEVSEGIHYVSVDYLSLSASDLPHLANLINNVPPKHSVDGLETFQLDIQTSEALNLTIENLANPIGVASSEHSSSVIQNLHTSVYKLIQKVSTASGAEITYDSTDVSNTQLKEGQKNRYFVTGNMSSAYDVSYEIIERLDNDSGQDTLFHFVTDLSQNRGEHLYSLTNTEKEFLVKAGELADTNDVDFYISSVFEPWSTRYPQTGVFDESVIYSRLHGASESFPLYIHVIESDGDDLYGDVLGISSPIVFSADKKNQINGSELLHYELSSPSYLLSFSAEKFNDDVYITGETQKLTGLNGSSSIPKLQDYTLLCDDTVFKTGGLAEDGIEDALSGCIDNAQLEVSFADKLGSENKRTEFIHEFNGNSTFLKALSAVLVNEKNEIIASDAISTTASNLLLATGDGERLVNQVSWKLSHQEEWKSVAIMDIEGDYTQKAELPPFYTELTSLDLKIVHSYQGAQTTHTLYNAVQVGVDLSSHEDDVDGDGIVNAEDYDNDNDGMPDSWEKAVGLNPLNQNDGTEDSDNDGLSNYKEYAIGYSPFNNDTDGDGIADGIAFESGVNEKVQAGQVFLLSDFNSDGNSELAVTYYEDSNVKIQILDGARFIVLNSYTYSFNIAPTSFSVYSQATSNNKLFFFGINDDGSANGKPIAIMVDTASGTREARYSWPSIFKDAKLVILNDINGDGTPEVGVSGVHSDLERPQMIVRDGASSDILTKLSFPSLFSNANFLPFSDVNGDDIEDIAMFAEVSKNGRLQVKVTNVLDGEIAMAYAFPNKWSDTSLHRLSDIDFDGVDDWGLFGKSRDDGRWMLMQKRGNSAEGMLQRHAWPADLKHANFTTVPDLNGDGVSEVAVSGVRESVDRFQIIIKNGADRNHIMGSYGWPNEYESVSFKISDDFTGDGVPELIFTGKQINGNLLQFVTDLTTNERISRVALDSDFLDVVSTVTTQDINFDGKKDVVVLGEKVSGELHSQGYLIH